MAKVIFDDGVSLFHLAWGLLTALSGPLAFILAGAFIIYQRQEAERPDYTLGDMMEYLTGWLLGLQWLQWFQWK